MTRSADDDHKQEKEAEPAKSQGSLTEKLAFKSRFVLIFGEIDHAMARSTCERLIALAEESAASPRTASSAVEFFRIGALAGFLTVRRHGCPRT